MYPFQKLPRSPNMGGSCLPHVTDPRGRSGDLPAPSQRVLADFPQQARMQRGWEHGRMGDGRMV